MIREFQRRIKMRKRETIAWTYIEEQNINNEPNLYLNFIATY